MRLILRFVAVIAVASLLLTGGVVAFAPQAGDVITASSSTREELELSALAERSIVYDRNGAVMATLHGEENREPVSLADVPDEVVQTILAIEDAEFYEHAGVNIRATFRALFENVAAGEIEQGGSTITMQVVKNLILTPAQDLNRKVKEIVLAVQLEDQMEKDEILELYLNTVYFGGGAYGVQAAAEIYWQKPVGELGWAEAALLAAVIRNPVGYDPIFFPEIALERRTIVFERLVALEIITQAEADALEAVPLPTERKPVLPPPEDYFVEEVKLQLLADERLGATYQERENAVFRGGLRIFTTLDPAAQEMAERARDETLPADVDPFTASIVAIEPVSGAVRAVVGGPGFKEHQYNIATHLPGRQTGSSFKTFVLVAALENGYVPNDRLAGGGAFPNPGGQDDPYQIKGSGGTIRGITLASSNGGYVRLGQIVGLDEVVETARRMGLTVPLDPGSPSMPLGVFEVPPFQMAAANQPIAFGGLRHQPFMISRVEDSRGNLVFQHQANPTRAISRQSACLATDILWGNTRSGTGTRARIGEQPVAGKTGTTEKFSDAWFVGFSPYLVTAVWMGAPEERISMTNVGGVRVFGGTYPAQIFSHFMGAYHADRPVVEFPRCEATRGGQFIKLGNENEELEPCPEPTEGGAEEVQTENCIPREEPPQCDEETGKNCEGEEPVVTTTTEPPGTTTTAPPATTTTLPPVTTTLPPVTTTTVPPP